MGKTLRFSRTRRLGIFKYDDSMLNVDQLKQLAEQTYRAAGVAAARVEIFDSEHESDLRKLAVENANAAQQFHRGVEAALLKLEPNEEQPQ